MSKFHTSLLNSDRRFRKSRSEIFRVPNFETYSLSKKWSYGLPKTFESKDGDPQGQKCVAALDTYGSVLFLRWRPMCATSLPSLCNII